jgi:hypothetical protein
MAAAAMNAGSAMARRAPARGWRAALAALLLAAPAGVLHAAPDPAKPQVRVGFEIEAPKFLHLPGQAAARQDLAARIAGELGRRYRFADWPAGAGPAADATADPPIGSLTARLVQVPAHPGPQILVQWFAGFGSSAPVELNLTPIEIYAPSNPDWDTHNAAAFVSRVAQQVMPFVRSDGFQRQVLREVVQRLPIASSVEPLGAERVVVLPRMWKHLQLGQESKLVLVFTRGSGPAEEQGMLKLVLPSQRPSDPGLGRLQAAVHEASFGTQPLPLTQGWHAQLPALLGGARVACYIRDYHPADAPGTLGAVMLEAP